MNIQQINQIENCFNPHHTCDMSNLSRPTVEETKDFLELLAEYKQESHVLLHICTILDTLIQRYRSDIWELRLPFLVSINLRAGFQYCSQL